MKLNKFSKRIVAFVIIANCIFTMAILTIFIATQLEPTTLIVSWFSFTGTELLALAAIKIKDKGADTYERQNDEPFEP